MTTTMRKLHFTKQRAGAWISGAITGALLGFLWFQLGTVNFILWLGAVLGLGGLLIVLFTAINWMTSKENKDE